MTSKSSGFTLIELLVVVAILGIIAAVGIVSYNGYDEGEFKSVEEVLDFWKSNNKSNANESLENLGSTSVYSEFYNTSVNVNFEKYTFDSDENNSEIVHYKIINGGHWWDYSSDKHLKTSTILWDFFSKHSKQ